MSGGVDSSVAAHLLRQQGCEVEGLSLILYEARMKGSFTGCCSIGAINDAQRTAEHMGIRHSRLDLRNEFLEKVIEPFIEAYSKGLTPNPCILCNRHIKFPSLLRFADERKAEFIATGHYARTAETTPCVRLPAGQTPLPAPAMLGKGIDLKKDQSYVLYALRPEELSRLVLPLGEKRKDEVREIARALDLPAAKRPESQEICFVEDGKYFRFLENLTEGREGPIIDTESGKIIGTHKGIHLFTIGQRKRLGIATGRPLFVAGIDRSKNAVYVGPKETAMTREFMLDEINWLMPPIPSSGTPHSLRLKPYGLRASVKVRSMMKDEPALLAVLDDGRVRVVFDEPQWAPAPGQSAVFYDGDMVLGGGVISGSAAQN